MKIFISWSGQRSKAVAELFSEWIKCVLQCSQPWVSTRDLERGAIWFNQLSEQLEGTSLGLVCLTAENKDEPWILFEAGALSKGHTTSRVCTLLVDLKPSDIKDPLAQLNHSLPNREGMWSLVQTLNRAAGAGSLKDDVLTRVFNQYWPVFETDFAKILQATPEHHEDKASNPLDLLPEILLGVRELTKRVIKQDFNNRQLTARTEKANLFWKEVAMENAKDKKVLKSVVEKIIGIRPTKIEEEGLSQQSEDAPKTASSDLDWLLSE